MCEAGIWWTCYSVIRPRNYTVLRLRLVSLLVTLVVEGRVALLLSFVRMKGKVERRRDPKRQVYLVNYTCKLSSGFFVWMVVGRLKESNDPRPGISFGRRTSNSKSDVN